MRLAYIGYLKREESNSPASCDGILCLLLSLSRSVGVSDVFEMFLLGSEAG